MIWRIGLASFLLLFASLATAHEPVLLDDRRATPDLRLELTELPSPTPASARYQMRASGLPRGVVFGVWAKDFGHSFHEVATGVWLDESGAIVSSESWVWRWWCWISSRRPRRLDEMGFEPGLYLRHCSGWTMHSRTGTRRAPRRLLHHLC
jgi:hypothetical protein